MKLKLLTVLLLAFVSLFSITSFVAYKKDIFRAKVLGVSVENLESGLKLPYEIPVSINSEDNFKIKLSDIGAYIDYENTKEKASSFVLQGTFQEIAVKILNSFSSGNEVQPVVLFDEQKLDEQISLIAGSVYKEPIYPDVEVKNSQINISSGEFGQEISEQELKMKILDSLSNLDSKAISLVTHSIGRKLSDQEISKIKDNRSSLIGKSLVLSFERFTYRISDEQLVELSENFNGTKAGPFESLLLDLKPNVEREAKNPIFEEKDGRVSEFVPATQGIEINETNLKNVVTNALANGSFDNPIEIPTNKTDPAISTDQINKYGIKELIGYGESFYKGSINERIHNVSLAASKFNGILVAPGQIVSFLDTVGDISTFTGFKQSYVIMDNKTVLGDGGGVCQVSTTLFRAVLNAGLTIVERRPHAYRVGYYEQGSKPGIDATIYSPGVDFKFKNDTANYILIQTKIENNSKLTFEIYGTKDGRVVYMTEPVISEVTPAPEDLYMDDPTLPAGTIKQIDYKANGAKVSFNYKVLKEGQVLFEKTFYSNYRAWQAKFLRGTGPAI